MTHDPLLRAVDAVTVPVPSLDEGLGFYRDRLGQELLWRNDEVGQAGLRLPDGGTELVLCTGLPYAPAWLVGSVPAAVARLVEAGGRVVSSPAPIPVGNVAVVEDPFGNRLVLVDLSGGRYTSDATGRVTGTTTAGTASGDA